MQPEPRIPLCDVVDPAAAAATLAITQEHDRAAFLARAGAWRRAFAATSGRDHALHLSDSFEFAAALFGGWLAGKTLWLPGDTLPATLETLRPRVDGWAGELPGGLNAALGGEGPDTTGSLDPAACRVVLFTSGSTGEPSAIVKTLRQLDSEIETLEAQFGAALGDAVVQGTVSHQHIYGLLFRILWPLSARRPFARTRLVYTEELAALGEQPIVLVASPAHLKRLPEMQDWRQLSQGLRVVFSSGGALPMPSSVALPTSNTSLLFSASSSTFTRLTVISRSFCPTISTIEQPTCQARLRAFDARTMDSSFNQLAR